VELTAGNGERIVLDLGLPLDALENTPDLLPEIRGLTEKTDDLLGLIISHAHQDHFALGKWIDKRIPVFMGAAAHRIIKASANYLKRINIDDAFSFENVCEIKGFVDFNLGPFKIVPYPVDHAAYESFAFLIEVDGKKIFYTGDFRIHGRTSNRTAHIMEKPPLNVDVLLMEGSSIERLNQNERFETEADLEKQFSDVFKNTKGLVLAHSSSQNIDRIVTIYRAAKRNGRKLVMSGYTGRILMALENPNIPNFTWPDVKKLTQNAQKPHEITAGQIAEKPGEYVYIGTRGLSWLEKAGLLTPEAHYIYSMWSGYKEDFAAKTIAKITETGVPMTDIHTSGHADIPTLKELVKAIKPRVLVPIHTFYPEQFADLFGEFAKVEQHQDNEQFEV
jgi:ribonuclease J